jgi:hypothetical protein
MSLCSQNLNPICRSKFGYGEWIGWYSTNELKNAIKFGYLFEVLEGYIFKAEDLFSKYIEKLYNMKATSPKNSPKYQIAKLLLNSLYGRFGMAPIMNHSEIVQKQNMDIIIRDIGIENIISEIPLGYQSLIVLNDEFVDEMQINVAIALCVTANARVDMSVFKNNPKLTGKLYYTDTDSAFIEKELPKYMVDETKLGKMKLEYILTEFVALGTKL